MSETLAPVEDRRRRSRNVSSALAIYFSVPGLHLCLPLDCVGRVLPIMTLQEVPQAPQHAVGLMNLGGEIIPVLDLAMWLRRPDFSYDLDTPILLCTDGMRSAGLLVQAVGGVGSIENNQRQMAGVSGEGPSPFISVFDRNDVLTFMLDIDSVLDVAASGDPTQAIRMP